MPRAKPAVDIADRQLAGQLRRAITSSGRSAYAIAKASGLDQGIIARFSRGERDLSLASAGKIAEALGLHLRPRKKEKREEDGSAETGQGETNWKSPRPSTEPVC